MLLKTAILGTTLALGSLCASAVAAADAAPFPRPLDSYASDAGLSLGQVLWQRVVDEPLNGVATLIFLLALAHTFLAPRFTTLAHRLERGLGPDGVPNSGDEQPGVDRRSFKVELLHFMGEVEAVFGIWSLPLLAAITLLKGWPAAEHFVSDHVDFSEAMFVVVIMAVAGTRPVLAFAERVIGLVANLGGGSPLAWWLVILTVGPLFGSLITEPGAMIISALLLARRLYPLGPSPRLAYATLGLLFVNVSVGGTFTSFAAPPVLMVARHWGWDTLHMLTHFGWKAGTAILISNAVYALAFRREFAGLARRVKEAPGDQEGPANAPVPAWITGAHLAFLSFIVLTAHTPALFVGAFLFFLAFVQATGPHQHALNLRSPLMVGFFLGGLVIHGTLQQWWIAPVLGRMGTFALLVGATILTSFNDNAAITYLASLVPAFTPAMKYAVMAGAVTGGGLTVIANAPNPAGQSTLARFFDDSVSPVRLFLGALTPTLIVFGCFLWL